MLWYFGVQLNMPKSDKDKKDMKKFTFKGVLDGFRSTVQQPACRPDQDIQESLKIDHFEVKKTFRHGFPFEPTAIAFDPVQRLLAIGSKCGSLRILGRPGVDAHARHDSTVITEPVLPKSGTDSGIPGSIPGSGNSGLSGGVYCGSTGTLGTAAGSGAASSGGGGGFQSGPGPAVVLIQFLVNEGALVTATSDDSLHLWNLRQKTPTVVQSLKFQRERITCLHLPLQSKWLYVGTERGNVHVVQIETFVLSGYIINWNKAIELLRTTHPGPIVHLSDNPTDHSKLLIGYETGQIVLWDLRIKCAEFRWQSTEPLRSAAWHYEGRQFMCSHKDGSLTTWMLKQPKPINVSLPHAKTNKDGKLEACKPIQKVEWKCSRSGEAYVIFSGGMAFDNAGRKPSVTVMHSKTTTVLEVEHNVVDFITLCESPYTSDLQEPYAIVVLLQNDLVVIDLQTAGFPCIENPYPMDLHESPVTCCSYLVDCPAELIPAFYSVGMHNRAGFSKKEWPINGGEWSPQSCSYSEIIITGHADGSIKFWDASAGTLQVLYKLKTAKVFEKPAKHSIDSGGDSDSPFAIQLISICPESRKLCIAGASSHVVFFKFKKQESVAETLALEIPIVYEVDDENCSPDYDYPPSTSILLGAKTESSDSDERKGNAPLLKVRPGPMKKPPGFQAQFVCLTPCHQGQPPGHITALGINSSYGLLAYGNEAGIVVVDVVQKVCLLNIGTPDLYGTQDPYSRAPKSPKKGANDGGLSSDRDQPQARSPSIDQVLRYTPSEAPTPYPVSPCPTPIDPSEEATEELGTNEDDTPAQPCQPYRRKSSVNWKILKRQLFKNTFAPPEKRGSVFYSDEGGEEIGSYQPRVLSPVENSEECSSETIEVDDTIEGIQVEDLPLDTRPSSSESVTGEQEKAARPEHLDLNDETDRPVPPPRSKHKKAMEQRLLSVPNIKFTKHDFQTVKDLRQKDRIEKYDVSPQPSFAGNLMRRFSRVDKLDSSFSRSRSSSMSSLENITSEAIQCIAFAESYSKKTDPSVLIPTLWVGTSLGSVLTVLLAPPEPEFRSSHPCFVSLCGGPIFRLKGSILTMSFLDCNGALIPNSYEVWRDESKDKKDRTPTKTNNRMSPTLNETRLNSTTAAEVISDRQFVVIASEKQARVVALPSQTCIYRQQICDSDFVVKSEVISLRDSVCLLCYVSTGKLLAYSLPSLRPLLECDFLPLADLSFQTNCKQGIVDPMLSIWGQQLIVNEDADQIARTFCFSNRGHGLYLSSPSELQKFTICTDFCSNLNDMMGELFIALDMPEAPKESFFRGWFGGGSRSLDREELFGEASGKASKAVAKHIPGSANLQDMGVRVNSATGEVGRAHQLMLERGDKLSQLEERSARMANESETFASSAHHLMLKYKDKKWYQL